MNISLDKEQYVTLMKGFRLGYMFSSGSSLEKDRSKEEQKIDEVQRHLLSFSKDFGFDDRIDESGDETLELDNAIDIFHYMIRYDDEVFVREFLTFAAACEMHRKSIDVANIDQLESIQNKMYEVYERNGLKDFDIIITNP